MRQRLTYANVVGTLLLIAALVGGTAAALPGKNSVQANDLKKNSVKARAIAANAVRAAEIKDGAVGSAEIADEGLAYADLGSNAVVHRVRLPNPVTTGDGGPIAIELEGSTWAQAPDETHVLFGDAVINRPGACQGSGALWIDVEIDGVPTPGGYIPADTPGTHSGWVLTTRPFFFESGAQETHTLTAEIGDTCANAGENLVLEQLDVTVIAMR